MPTEKAHGYQITKMCETFSLLGLEVHLIVPKRKNWLKDDPFVFYGLKKSSFFIHELAVVDFITPLPITLPPFSYVPYWLTAIIFLLKAKMFLRRRLDKSDILYTRQLEVAWFFRNHPRLIFEVHELSKLFEIGSRPWKKVARLVTITSQLKKLLVDCGFDEKRVLVAPSVVDLADFKNLPSKETARMSLGLPRDRKLVGYIGKFSALSKLPKGVDNLIASLGFLGSDVLAVLVGGFGEEIKHYRELAEKMKLEERVIFVPFQTRSKVPLYLKAMDVVVVPSPKLPFYEHYSSPAKLFEYMAAGVPIVASDLPSLREVLNEGNAVLVKADSAQDLALGIGKILENAELAQCLSHRALIDVKEYNWAGRASRILYGFR